MLMRQLLEAPKNEGWLTRELPFEYRVGTLGRDVGLEAESVTPM